MGKYVDKTLTNNEQVIYTSKLHWIDYAIAAFFGVMFSILALLTAGAMGMSEEGPPSIHGETLFWGLVIAWAPMVYSILNHLFSEFVITNKRIVMKQGVISRSTLEISTKKLESLGIEQGITGRILGYGTIVFSGTGGAVQKFNAIDDPLEFNRAAMAIADSREN